MSAPSKSPEERTQFSVPMKCKCGQYGVAVWEENKNLSRSGPETSLISLSDGFFERIVKKDRFSIEVVCHACGAVQPG
jgi:hypothetical protein